MMVEVLMALATLGSMLLPTSLSTTVMALADGAADSVSAAAVLLSAAGVVSAGLVLPLQPASTVSSMAAAIRIATKRFIKKILLLIDKWRYFFQTCSKTRSQFSPKILRIASSEYPRATRPRVTLINER